MRVVYLLDQAPLFGGVKVVLEQATLLSSAGHEVAVRCTGPAPEWFDVDFPWLQTEVLAAEPVPADTVVIATYWTTIEPAMRLAAKGRALHYCQGYEARYSHNRDEHPRILEAYAQPLPALCVSDHLARMLEEDYGRRAQVVRQPLSVAFRPARRRPPASLLRRSPPRILVMSPFEVDWKGVPTALDALAEVRRRGIGFQLVRLSQMPRGEEEAELDLGGEYHHHLPPDRVPDLVRSCDLLLAPSREAEGFGLPVLEAMASGVPAVASSVSCFLDWTDGAALLVEGECAADWADAVESVLASAPRWRELRRRGLAVAGRYTPEASRASVEKALADLVGFV